MRSYFREALAGAPEPAPADYACPHCGEVHNVAEALNAEAPQVPEPGSVMICEDCGELGEFVTATRLKPITIAEVPAEVRKEVREAMARVRTLRPGHIPKGYLRVVQALDALLLAHLRENEAPLFAIPEKGVRIAGDVGDLGERFARNDSARAFVRKAATPAMTGRERPTLFMLACVLEARGVPVERISIAEMRAMGAHIMPAQGAGQA